MKLLLILIMILVAACTGAPPKHTAAAIPFIQIKTTVEKTPWWLRAEYSPSADVINNIPVKNINQGWCAANTFSFEEYAKALGPEEINDLKRNSNIAFQLTEKFDGMRALTALSGVYQKCTGEKGNFILLLEQERFISVVEINRNAPGFMGLLSVADNFIGVAQCLDCDDIELLTWDSAHNRLTWQEDK